MICHLEGDSFVKTIETQTTTIDFVKILLHKVIETAAINLIEILFDKVVESPTVNLVKILLDKIVESTTVNFVEILLFNSKNHAPKSKKKLIGGTFRDSVTQPLHHCYHKLLQKEP